MRVALTRAIAVAAALVPLAASGAAAQVVEIQAGIGLYQPLTDQVRATDQTTGQRSAYHLGAAPAIGGRALLWISDVFAFEAGGLYAEPTRTVTAAATASSPSTITLLSIGGVRRIPLGEATALRIGAGVARIKVGGTSYDTSAAKVETVSGGVTVSAAVTRNLGSKLALVLGIEDWIYLLDEVRGAPSLVSSGIETVRQNDLVFSVRLAAKL